jgi:hypothetical protein
MKLFPNKKNFLILNILINNLRDIFKINKSECQEIDVEIKNNIFN